jgi:hypothetical protein
MKITRDFSHGQFNGKKGESLSQDQMRSFGRTILTHLKDVAGVIEGDVPADIGDEPAATNSRAITASEAERDGVLAPESTADQVPVASDDQGGADQGGADQGGADQGGADQGGSAKGGAKSKGDK